MTEDTAMPDVISNEVASYPHLILPGEILSAVLDQPLKLGSGLRHISSTPAAGLLHGTKQREFYIDYNSHRVYTDSVTSLIRSTSLIKANRSLGKSLLEQQKVTVLDVNSAHPGILSTLAFEAATKQNQPQLNVTQLVYARLATANKDIEPEIECVNPTMGKSAGFGELKGGLLVEGLRMQWCRWLMKEDKEVLAEIGVHVGFQCAVGMNERVWVDAGDIGKTILVARAIQEAEGLSNDEMRKPVKELVLKS